MFSIDPAEQTAAVPLQGKAQLLRQLLDLSYKSLNVKYVVAHSVQIEVLFKQSTLKWFPTVQYCNLALSHLRVLFHSGPSVMIWMQNRSQHILVSLMSFKSEDLHQVCPCHTIKELTVRKQAVTIYTATHLTRHLSKQKVLNPALACLSVPDIWLITVWPLQQRKTADEKSECLQAQPVPTATCVLTCKILSPYVSSSSPPPFSPAPGPFVQTR